MREWVHEWIDGCYTPCTTLIIYLINLRKFHRKHGETRPLCISSQRLVCPATSPCHCGMSVTSYYSQISLCSGFLTGSRSRGTEKAHDSESMNLLGKEDQQRLRNICKIKSTHSVWLFKQMFRKWKAASTTWITTPKFRVY